MSRRRGLGRGLDALLGDHAINPNAAQERTVDDVPAEGTPAATPSPASAMKPAEVPIHHIERSQYQPRRYFDDAALEELAESIRRHGVMQPVVVRELAPDRYELIAGERRWRAAQIAGLDTLPTVLRAVSDADALALALIENIQREDLGPLEQAIALQRLQQEFELTQQQVADAVGKSRTAVTNLLRLLSLGGAVRSMLEAGDLEMGHARALLSLDELAQVVLAREIVDQGLSVRETERRVRVAQKPSAPKKPPPPRSADTARLERELGDRLGAPVTIRHRSSGSGQLLIKYSTVEELEGILSHMK